MFSSTRLKRPQFNDLIMATVNKKPSEVYGSAHLLRLMVKIGTLLSKFKINHGSGGGDSKLVQSSQRQTAAYNQTFKLFQNYQYH